MVFHRRLTIEDPANTKCVDRKTQTPESLSLWVDSQAYCLVETSGSELECGLYAIVESLAYQLDGVDATNVDELREIATSVEMRHRFAIQQDPRGNGNLDHNNFGFYHVAAVLETWGRQRGLPLQLGVIVDGQPRGLMSTNAEEEGAITIWLHNDDTSGIAHYSGLRPVQSSSYDPQPIARQQFWYGHQEGGYSGGEDQEYEHQEGGYSGEENQDKHVDQVKSQHDRQAYDAGAYVGTESCYGNELYPEEDWEGEGSGNKEDHGEEVEFHSEYDEKDEEDGKNQAREAQGFSAPLPISGPPMVYSQVKVMDRSSNDE